MINWQRNIALFVSLLVLCAFAFLFLLCRLGYFWEHWEHWEHKDKDYTITPPFAFPFVVERAGNQVSFGFEVAELNLYEIGLMYPLRDDREIDSKKGWGGVSGWKDVPLTIRLQVAEMDGTGAVVFNKEITAPRISSRDIGINAKLIKIRLPPGRYKITAESLKDVPELRDTKINFQIIEAYTGK